MKHLWLVIGLMTCFIVPVFASLTLSSSDISSGGDLVLGNFKPGDANYNLPGAFTINNSSAFPGIELRCKDDSGSTWYLTVTGGSLTSSGGAALNSTAFQVLPTYAQYNDGTASPPDSNSNTTLANNLTTLSFTALSSTPVTLYTSTSGATYNLVTGSNYVGVKVQFAVLVPGSAPAGNYTSTLAFTLTE